MKTITIKADTKLSDLKVGDLVMTAEIHRITKIDKQCKGERTDIRVVDVRPQCGTCGKHTCKHEHFMWLGWGQHKIAKILKRGKSEK